MFKLEYRTNHRVWRSKKLARKAIKNKKQLTTYFGESEYAVKNGLNSYREYLNSAVWKAKSADYKSRFPLCEYCRKAKPVNVHHRNYQNVGHEKYWDLLAVCKDCHNKQHGL